MALLEERKGELCRGPSADQKMLLGDDCWAPSTVCSNFPGGSVVKNPPDNTEDTGSSPVSGTCPGGGDGNPLQYSCPKNSMDRQAWQATIHGVTKS